MMRNRKSLRGLEVAHRVAGFMSVLALVAALLLSAGSACALPQDGVVHRNPANGHLYSWIADRIEWEEADTFADSYEIEYEGITRSDWHLATITSAEENSFVFEVVLDNGDYIDYGIQGSESWLGAIVTDGSVGNFEWVTGEPFVYSNFGPNDPSHVRENVLEMGGVVGPRWNDEDGPGSSLTVRQSFIVETIPEPGTLSLLALAGLALLRRRRK